MDSSNSTPRGVIPSACVFSYYNIGEHIGSGFLGSVHQVFPKSSPTEKCLVVKIMAVDDEQNLLRA